MKKYKYILFLLVILTTQISCLNDVGPIEPEIEQEEVLSFTNDIQPIFTQNCTSCHPNSQKDIFDIARRGNVSEIKNILKTNSSLINKKNKSGYTPLILASYYDNEKIVNYLIKNKVNIDEISDLGTALMAASYKNNNKSAKLLINNNANVNLSDTKGTTALHYACINQNIELVKLLINKDAKISLKDYKDKTPLDYAIEKNNIEIIKILKH